MCQPKRTIRFKNLIILLCFIPIHNGLPQDTTTIRPGRYIPELYGANLGKYIPDDSGKYYHIHRPYDGGYGDTGIKYVHDASGNLVPLSTKKLSRKDHLRFMLDFNFDNSGWQIVNFEWIRDGDESYNYKYVNENQLFMHNGGYEDEAEDSNSDDKPNEENMENNDESDVHVEGEYSNNKGYNYSYNNNDGTNRNSIHLQQAIREVIYHIENNILPTL